jgi:hypothetical protein
MDVSSKPSLTMLDQYSKIIKSVDDQTRQLKLSSPQKIVLYEVDFLNLELYEVDFLNLEKF